MNEHELDQGTEENSADNTFHQHPERDATQNASAFAEHVSNDSSLNKGEYLFGGRKYYSIKRTQEILHERGTDVSDSFIRSKLQSKQLASYKMNGRRGLFIPVKDFERFFDEGGFEMQLLPAYE